MLSHSDVYKPDKTMMATKQIKIIGSDLGICTAAGCVGNSYFRVDRQHTGASWQFNWEDNDGSVVRSVDPSRPAGRYLIGSWVDWWNVDANCWRENLLSGIWVCPIVPGRNVSRLDMRVTSANAQSFFTIPYEWATMDTTRIGYVSNFAGVDRSMLITKTEGTTGVAGGSGWYVVYNPSAGGYSAPKRLQLYAVNLPRENQIYWTSCWPAGTTFTIQRTFSWSTCLSTPVVPVRRGGGDAWGRG
ncbi:hypothetical protein MNEG_13159 [Monoraphidium neglectum]|uniref:Uncharacterized protein n=1 Tax=Monoraphidium neglectum TaxID=145388 RepID=A0A0D2J4E2_9CHLO|nr:hypothetical protein MNEG_13159 [Monoraphidium neglectum]KIY94802.1 hypothetical protein MNEG_13159 [Monoraphidium neglectum]|eukprot:XP_013893822.1 hypothetical protein MNEG_13159 [Monoraphidium neglectum]